MDQKEAGGHCKGIRRPQEIERKSQGNPRANEERERVTCYKYERMWENGRLDTTDIVERERNGGLGKTKYWRVKQSSEG